MRTPISANHPLRRLFTVLAGKRLPGDPEIVAYVTNLLVDFVHVDQLYRIRNARNKRLEEVGEMLLESNPLLEAPSSASGRCANISAITRCF